MKPTFLFAALAAMALFACKNENRTQSMPANAPLEWQMMKMQEKICLSPKDTDRCGSVTINLPVAAGGNFPAITSAINDTLKKHALATLNIGDGKPATTIEAGAKAFMDEYEKFTKENSDFPGGYAVDIAGKPIFNSSKIASVEVSNYLFTGGAHPSHWTDLQSFDRKTGKSLTAADLFTDPAAVAKLLEKPFCEAKKDEKGAVPTLTELVFEGTKFGLPQNMAVVAEGVRFYYNPYEMTAYAVGDFDLLLTWAQLGTLAKKGDFLD